MLVDKIEKGLQIGLGCFSHCGSRLKETVNSFSCTVYVHKRLRGVVAGAARAPYPQQRPPATVNNQFHCHVEKQLSGSWAENHSFAMKCPRQLSLSCTIPATFFSSPPISGFVRNSTGVPVIPQKVAAEPRFGNTWIHGSSFISIPLVPPRSFLRPEQDKMDALTSHDICNIRAQLSRFRFGRENESCSIE